MQLVKTNVEGAIYENNGAKYFATKGYPTFAIRESDNNIVKSVRSIDYGLKPEEHFSGETESYYGEMELWKTDYTVVIPIEREVKIVTTERRKYLLEDKGTIIEVEPINARENLSKVYDYRYSRDIAEKVFKDSPIEYEGSVEATRVYELHNERAP